MNEAFDVEVAACGVVTQKFDCLYEIKTDL